jgi:hypothetical protein
MVNKEPRPCCICGLQFDSFGHNPEPFDGDIGMCCDDCDNRWVTPVRILFGRDGLDRFVPPSHPGAPLVLFKKLAEMGAGFVATAKVIREARETQRNAETNQNP